MKRTLLFLMSVIMVLSAYAQKSTSIKAFEYPDYLCPNPYTGKPIYGGNTLEISYSEKKNSYGIDFRYGYIRYMINLTYKGMDNGRYVYTGFEIGNMAEVIVMTSTKLSRFLDNYGQMQNERFEKDKLIEIHIGSSGSLSVYPIKDTPENRKKIEEKINKQEVENIAQNNLEELYPYGVQVLQDSLKQQVVKEFFDNGGEVKSFNLQPYSFHTYVAVIDTNKQVTVIQKDEVILNKYMFNQIIVNGTYCAIICLLFLKLPIIRHFIRNSQGDKFLYTAYFALFIFMGICNSFASRTHRLNIFAHILQNKVFLIINAFIFFAQIYIIYYGGNLFRTYGLTFKELLFCLILSLTVFPIDYLRKYILKKRNIKIGV